MARKALVTGGTGCIGAEATYELSWKGSFDEILVLSRSGNPGLLNLWFEDGLPENLRFVPGDISDLDCPPRVLQEEKPSHILHLAALQSPACAANPVQGAMINVVGTTALYEAARKLAEQGVLERVVDASSAAVYGPRDMYAMETIPETVVRQAPNLYGAWKIAGEEVARLFQESTGVPTISLRLNTTYGPGRDAGMTSAPTTAMKAIALGKHRGEKIPFRMPYGFDGGRENYHWVGDVGASFAHCVFDPFEGREVFNIRGETIPIENFLGVIRRAADEMDLGDFVDIGIADDAAPALFICDLDHSAFDAAFPNVPFTRIEQGVPLALKRFVAMAEQGTLAELPKV